MEIRQKFKCVALCPFIPYHNDTSLDFGSRKSAAVNNKLLTAEMQHQAQWQTLGTVFRVKIGGTVKSSGVVAGKEQPALYRQLPAPTPQRKLQRSYYINISLREITPEKIYKKISKNYLTRNKLRVIIYM